MDFASYAPYNPNTWEPAPYIRSPMKILMLGWEYPPHIAGGLGTACQGLTNALASQGVNIHFVVPQLFGNEEALHMVLSDSERQVAPKSQQREGEIPAPEPEAFPTTRIPAFLSPYWNPRQFKEAMAAITHQQVASLAPSLRKDPTARALIDGDVYGVDLASALEHPQPALPDEVAGNERYSKDLFLEVERFTMKVISQFAHESFDVIHAHDWMTFPAGVALAEMSGKPLIVHVHSLEHDRSGLFVHPQINEIERFGLQQADKIIAVSYFTKRSIERHHGIPSRKVQVVHNGVYDREAVTDYRSKKTWPSHVVAFVGRVTFQKGPEYFIEVASKVVPHIPDVLFVMAGSGDMLPAVMERAKELKLTQNFMFPGFIKGEELEEVFSVADLYVMPSVSEPFGITALEAISFDTPVIISKQSGVAEVIEHALKVDFWDVDRMADLIINALNHPELRRDLARMAREELKQLHWDAAATKTIEVYQEVQSPTVA
jgi:glycosyltransferase involved in cell wall biosynthesis